MEDEPSCSTNVFEPQIDEGLPTWTRNLKLLPTFTYDKLQKHLCASEKQSTTKKDEKLGYRLFKEGYIKNTQVKPNIPNSDNGKSFILKATVHATMKKLNYTVYVHLNQETGDVIRGHCSCKAGKGGRCKHVAAMLYQIIDYVQLELLEVPLSLTCTQVLQKWNVPHGEASDDAVLFEDRAFKKSSYLKDKKRKHRNENNLNYNPTTSNHQVTETDIKTLVSSLECSEKAQYLCNVLRSNNCQPVFYNEVHSKLPSKKRCTDSLQPNLNDSHVREQILENLKGSKFTLANIPPEKAQLATNLEVTYEQMLEIELNTRGQASCERWYNERKHRITASNFGIVLKRRKSIFPKSILNTILSSSKSSSCPAPCKWGKQNETEALKQYVLHKQNSVNVSSCGFVVSQASPWLGASPDFLINDPTESTTVGLGEIKCPYSKRDETIDEACEDKTFFLSKVDGNVFLKRNHSYYYQVQGSLGILQLKWSDFIVYTKKGLHVERILFDDKLWKETMLPQLTEFYFEYVFPQINH